jgi:hypothetical protein
MTIVQVRAAAPMWRNYWFNNMCPSNSDFEIRRVSKIGMKILTVSKIGMKILTVSILDKENPESVFWTQ